MAKVHRRDTGPEVRLRRELWRAGIRGWRCDYAQLPGRPDIAFPRHRLAVFVDGLLWHGHPRRYPANLDPGWRAKIERNVARDREVDRQLVTRGWRVLRIWDDEVNRDTVAAVARVVAALAEPVAPVGE